MDKATFVAKLTEKLDHGQPGYKAVDWSQILSLVIAVLQILGYIPKS